MYIRKVKKERVIVASVSIIPSHTNGEERVWPVQRALMAAMVR